MTEGNGQTGALPVTEVFTTEIAAEMGRIIEDHSTPDRVIAQQYLMCLERLSLRMGLLLGTGLGDLENVFKNSGDSGELRTTLIDLIVEGKGAERRIQVGFKGELATALKLLFNLEDDLSGGH